MAFNPKQFLDQKHSGPMSTQPLQVPEGEYRAMIGEITEDSFREARNKETGNSFPILRVPFNIVDEALLAQMKRDRVTVDKDIFLDIDAATGGLSFAEGDNSALGQIRDAVGQQTTKNWSILNLSNSGPVMIKVTHQIDKNDPEKKYARVTRVAKITR